SHKSLKNGKIVTNKKIRKILYATHIDAHIYSYYAQELQGIYEEVLKKDSNLSDAVTAYRRIQNTPSSYKNNVHFAGDVFNEIKSRKNCAVLAFDIENFFPSLNHSILKRT